MDTTTIPAAGTEATDSPSVASVEAATLIRIEAKLDKLLAIIEALAPRFKPLRAILDSLHR